MKTNFLNIFYRFVSIGLSLIFYYYLILFIVLLVLSIICAFYFLFSGERFPFPEIEDYSFFNTYFKDIAQGMLYDMSYSQEQINVEIDTILEQLKNKINLLKRIK